MNLPLFINWFHRSQTDKTTAGVKIQVTYRGDIYYEKDFNVIGGDSVILNIDDLVDTLRAKGDS